MATDGLNMLKEGKEEEEERNTIQFLCIEAEY